jgi:hypothetical protein
MENNLENQITPQVVSAPGPMQPPSTRGGSKKKLVGLVTAGVVVIAAIASGATYIHLNNKPEKVLADAFTNTVSDVLEKKPVSSVSAVVFESKGATPAKVSVKLDNKSDGKNGQGRADIIVDFAGKTYNVTASAVVMGSNELYVKVENLKKTLQTLAGSQPAFSSYTEAFDPVITKIDNRWIKITSQDLKELGMPDEDKVDTCAKAVESVKLSKSDKNKMKKLFKENQFVVADEVLGSEAVSGEKSFHYKLDFNDKAAEGFAKQVINLDSLKQVKKDCDIDESKVSDALKSSEKGSSSDVKPVVELWIGKKSRRPTQFKVTASDKEFALKFDTTLKLNATDVVVKAPSGSISVTELQAEIEKVMNQQMSQYSNMSGYSEL